tara:strand:- start:1013 stop:1339 length:327 start_codon:yes stop_codon:yes gene_type:complete
MDKKTALLGYGMVEIVNPEGEPEQVKVNQIKASQIFDFQQISIDEAKVVEFLTGKPMKWVDDLSLKYPQEYGKLAEACMKVNEDFFSSFLKRNKSRLKTFSKIFNQEI